MADVRPHRLVYTFLARRRLLTSRAQARVLVEDARSGILSYIKRKWVLIRNAGGFDDLEPWCAKELADGASSSRAQALFPS